MLTCFNHFIRIEFGHSPVWDIKVLLKLVRSGECFITLFAAIRLHPSMDPNVTLQVSQTGRMLDHIPCNDKV